MYNFIKTENTEEFDSFVENAEETSFMQTSKWILLKSTWIPHMYTGYDQEGNVVLTALILERNLPAAGKIWYSPSGFICDYTNAELIKEFSAFVKKEMKRNRATAYIIDPQIVSRITDREIPSAKEKTDNLISAGFKYNDNLDDYTYQPPMTVGIYLKNSDGEHITKEALLKSFEKGVRYSVRIGDQRGLVAERYTYDDIAKNPQLYDDFLSVMNDTSDRIGFVTRPHEYYFDFMKHLSKWATIDLIYYDAVKDSKQNSENFTRLKEVKAALQTETKKSVVNKLKNEAEALESTLKAYRQRYKEVKHDEGDKQKICVACGVTIRFGNEACCLFGGTRNVIRNNVRSSHYLNFLRIEQSIAEGMDFHDMGRVPYEYTNEDSAHNGLYKFKRSFAADKVEYIAEYILIARKLKYNIYHNVMPTAKKVKLSLVKTAKKILKK